ncbi:VOC family protein [Actinoplanes sp. NPDC024001]|uniref:VOC family protein n=1 Tax=Actinoplanes sp. NPDC024001 TaxID=3154598 RepID=UPI0033C2EC19
MRETTSATMAGSIGWFEIGSAHPDQAQEFYGRLFGWRFAAGTSAGFDYRDISTGAGHPVSGGLLNTGGQVPGYAIFVILVDDVAATCERVVELGGRVDLGPLTTETGLAAAYLSDPDGNRFGVFTPPPAP